MRLGMRFPGVVEDRLDRGQPASRARRRVSFAPNLSDMFWKFRRDDLPTYLQVPERSSLNLFDRLTPHVIVATDGRRPTAGTSETSCRCIPRPGPSSP